MGGKRGGYEEEEEAISQTFFSPYTPRGASSVRRRWQAVASFLRGSNWAREKANADIHFLK